MRKLAYAFAAVALVGLSAGAWAGSASKFAAAISETTLVAVAADTDFGPTKILDIDIKTANKKDLLIGVSLETSILTRTKAKGKNGSADSESASGAITVCVEVDGQNSDPDVAPDCVTFDKRVQTLNTVLGGVIESCEDTCTFNDNGTPSNSADDFCDGEPDGIITVAFECVVTDEEIELILDTMSAHHFNFVARDLGPGDHEISILVSGTTGNSSTDSSATIGIGQGSLTVEEVRAVNDGTGIEFN